VTAGVRVHMEGAWRVPAPPASTHTVEAVVSALDAGVARGVPIVVQAPTGSGKTTAVASWLRSHPEWDSIWLGVTARDFAGLRRLAESASGMAPPAEPAEDSATWWARLVGHLGTQTRRLVAVVDGIDRIQGQVPLNRIVEALEQLPHVTLVLISRRALAHVDGRLSPRVHVVSSELAWDHASASAALALAGLDIPPDVVESLHSHCAGRAEAIVECATQWAQDRTSLAPEQRRRVKRLAACWFASRAAETLGEQEARLMLLVASLLEVPADLAERLGEVLDGAGTEQVARLAEAGFILERTSVLSGESVYSAPVALASELRSQALNREPDLCRAAHALAAELDSTSALHPYHRVLAGTGSAAELVIEQWRAPGGRSAEPAWVALQSIPMSTITTHPVLAALRVATDRAYSQSASLTTRPYHDALLSLTADDLRVLDLGDRLLVEAAIVDVLLVRDNPAAVVRRSQELADRQAARIDQLDVRSRRALSYLLVGVGEAQLALLRPDKALVTVEPVLEMEAGDRWLISKYRASVIAALCLSYNAERAWMRDALIEADLYFALGGYEPGPVQGLQRLAEFIDAMNSGEIDEAERVATRFAVDGKQTVVGSAMNEILAALVLAARGKAASSTGRFARIIASPRFPMQNPSTRAFALVSAADGYLADGQPGAVLDLLRGSDTPGNHALCFNVARAAAHLSLGQPALALEETQECVQPSLRHLTAPLTKVLALRAAAHLELRHPEAARTDLRSAFHRTPPAWRPATFGILPAAALAALRDLMAETGSDQAAAEALDALFADAPARRNRDFAVALTRKEAELLSLLSTDTALSDVARRMFVSINTIKTQSRSLYRKLGVTSRREAVDLTYAVGLAGTASLGQDEPEEGLWRDRA